MDRLNGDINKLKQEFNMYKDAKEKEIKDLKDAFNKKLADIVKQLNDALNKVKELAIPLECEAKVDDAIIK